MLIPDINRELHLYPILILASLIVGLLIPSIELHKQKIRTDILICVNLLNALLSLIFGKLYTILSGESTNIITAGFSSLGGLVGFILATYIFYKIYNNDKRILVNYISSLPLIYAISKIGCLLAGCCHGIEYFGPLSIRYEISSVCELECGVFPIQLLETIVFIGIYVVIMVLKNKETNLNIITLNLILCTVSKFALDYLRYSHTGKILSFNQIMCIVIAIIGVVYDRANKNIQEKNGNSFSGFRG